MSAAAGDNGWLAEELVTLAWCWRLDRRDGVTIGLTTHDRDLSFANLLWRSAPAMRPATLHQVDGLGSDRMDVEGALTSAAIAEPALLAGRWDGALLTLFAVDWTAAEARCIAVARGRLGAVTVAGCSFTVTLADGREDFDAVLTPATSAGCRASLGDDACRVPLNRRRSTAQVLGAEDRSVTLSTPPAAIDGYRHGVLRWLDGANAGLDALIIDAEGAALTLSAPPPFAVAPDTRVRLTRGCDKRAATCATRFANIANFRGEPHLPGIDLLTRYPGG